MVDRLLKFYLKERVNDRQGRVKETTVTLAPIYVGQGQKDDDDDV